MLTTGLTRITAVAALTFALTACSGDDSSGSAADERSPEDVVGAAAGPQPPTTGGERTRSTDGINAIQKAVGVATDAPAFEGTLTVLLTGQAFEVPVIAVDDEVFAQIPLTPGWSPVDPEEYGAPDPAGFLSPDDGFAAILGSVPGEVVDKVIPGASGDFDLTAQITEDDELRELALTGVFYSGAAPNTYTVGFEDYGTTQDITAP